MNINENTYTIEAIVKGYTNNGDNGVVAFGGNLNVRPAYQREFIYTNDKEKAVIDTILKDYPLNVMYWGTGVAKDMYELIDGQQRTMSICRFVKGEYSINYNGMECNFSDLPQDVRKHILDYELHIYICDGKESEKLDWFKTINVASEPLTSQELRNAVFTGAWLSSAKKYFSKKDCPAKDIADNYLSGEYNRQDILEKVLSWAADSEGFKGKDAIDKYMSTHRKEKDASALWEYFNKVITWVKDTFGEDIPSAKKVRWGILYNKYSSTNKVDENSKIVFYKRIQGKGEYPRADLLDEIDKLNNDDDVTSKTGIYDYLFSGDEKKLSIRAFNNKIKRKIYGQQNGKCGMCGKSFDIDDMQADHIIPWSKGGKTIEGNCQLLCVDCNLKKSNKSTKSTNEVYCSNCGKPITTAMKFCSFCGTHNTKYEGEE